ncbi:MAG: FKBP-type peptidyl-prolyl cis-trans isomerase [Bacteroidetes bacterium]|nr:FKBP-type peptidyl-prolyl cis-trans isomerase [Bacteroidota bacterium]
MKQLLIASACFVLMSCGGKKTELTNDKDSVSYSIGLDVGRTFQRQGIEVTPDAFLQGLKDAADTSGKPMLSDEQIQSTMMAFQQKMMAKQQEKMQQQSGAAIAEGEKFLAENKVKPGVVTTASGLQYKVIKAGSGKKPKASNEVKVHYRGTLVNGTEFDNSFKRGEAVTFPVGGVIPGWTEALQLMPVGSKWEVYIPAQLGYGNNATGPIPPGSTLIFEVELLAIVK